MTIHRLTSNIVFFALGLNIALASASPTIPETNDCETARECMGSKSTVTAIKISRPVRCRQPMALDLSIAAESAGL